MNLKVFAKLNGNEIELEEYENLESVRPELAKKHGPGWYQVTFKDESTNRPPKTVLPWNFMVTEEFAKLCGWRPPTPALAQELVTSSDGTNLTFTKLATESVLPFVQASSEILERYKGPLDVVLDVGAHIGTFTLLAVTRGAKFVLALEPDPVNFGCLQANLDSNKAREMVLALPVAAFTKSLDLVWLNRVAGVGGNSGQSSIAVSFSKSEEKIPVHTVDFSDLLRSVLATKGKIDFLKLDIEGAEWPIFDCGRIDVLSNVGYVDLELHMTRRDSFDTQISRVSGLMERLGFKGELIKVGDAARYYGSRK